MRPPMPLIVHSATILDGHHYNGERFWDGDQTLWELDIEQRGVRAPLLAVVPRGDAFIPEERVRRYVEELGTTLAELRSRARSPDPGRRPQIDLWIEPGE